MEVASVMLSCFSSLPSLIAYSDLTSMFVISSLQWCSSITMRSVLLPKTVTVFLIKVLYRAAETIIVSSSSVDCSTVFPPAINSGVINLINSILLKSLHRNAAWFMVTFTLFPIFTFGLVTRSSARDLSLKGYFHTHQRR